MSKTIRLFLLSFIIVSLFAVAIADLQIKAQSSNNLYLPVVMNIRAPILSGPGDWPMAGANPQRTSWTPTEVSGYLRPEWFTPFDAYIPQKVQIIATNNTLFISAADGLHALDSNSGQQKWFYATDLPLGHSPTFYQGVVYVGGLDRKIHAIDAETGRFKWSFTAEAGFDTNPLVINGILLAGNRDGYFYAIYTSGPQTGQLAWRYKTNGPITYSAAEKNGVVFFASNDMFAYALRITDGSLVWKSKTKLPGEGFYSWWPVVYQDYVVFSGSWSYRLPSPFSNATPIVLDKAAYPTNATDGTTIGAYGNEAGPWPSGMRTMNASRISQYHEAYPHRRTVIYLHTNTGNELTYDSDNDGRIEYPPYLHFGQVTGSRYPPVVGRDGVIYQANNYIYGGISRGFLTGWKLGTSTISVPTTDTNAIDEPIGYAVGGNTVYWKRCCDRKAGSFNLTSGKITTYYDEGTPLRRYVYDLYTENWDFSYWKHGDTGAPIPYNGRVYMINNNAVVAFSAQNPLPVYDDPIITPASGVPAATLERGTTATGLNTKVTLNNTSWPLLIQQERYFEGNEEANTRAYHFSLFEIAGLTSGSPGGMQTAQTGISSTFTSTYSGGNSLQTIITKHSPTVLFKNTSQQYLLRGKFVGYAFQNAAGTQVRMGNVSVSGSEMSEGWIIVWDSTETHRWAPMVLSLQNRPSQIRLDANGLLISFPGASGYLGVTPLYGMSAPKTNEVNTWPQGIPAETIQRIRKLNQISHHVPINNPNEKITIDGNTGDVFWDESYEMVDFVDVWNTNSPQVTFLPPSLALASWNGSPIRINGKPFEEISDLNYMTPLGRVAFVEGVTSLRITLPGLANYWRAVPVSTIPPNLATDPLREKLITEIQKIVNAGHLLPGYANNGLWDSRGMERIGHYLPDLWHNPAEMVYTLARALPLLPSDLQNQVKQYLQNEFNAGYRVHTISHVGWQSGTSREYFTIPPEVLSSGQRFPPCSLCSIWGMPGESYYAAWQYAQLFSNAGTLYNEIQKPNLSPQFFQSFPYALNNQIAAHMGYIRLGQMANAGPMSDHEATLARMLVYRAALSKYPLALEQTGFEYAGYRFSLRSFAPNMPDTLFIPRLIGTLGPQTSAYGHPEDIIYGTTGLRTGLANSFGIDFVNLTPELAKFMHDYSFNEDVAAINEYERRTPYWFVSKIPDAPNEGNIMPLYDTIALFQAKALILGASRVELEQYLDVPIVAIGDLYYIQRLILALQAN